jgi:predicted nucleotidyltransferase
MRITKEIAENAAKKLVAKKREQNAAKYKHFKGIAADLYKSTLPKEILEIFKKYPLYLSPSTSVNLYDNGNYIAYVDVNESLPQRDGRCSLQMDSNNLKLYRAIKAEKRSIDELEKTISNALYELRTLKNVEKHFPEAVQYIPAAQNTALAINLEPLRALINE